MRLERPHVVNSRLSVLALLAVAALGACSTVVPPQPKELDLWDDAAAGIDDPTLATLSKNVWDAYLRAHPIAATYLGDPRFNGDVPLSDPRWEEQRLGELGDFQRRYRGIDPAKLSERDRITFELLGEEIVKERDHLQLHLEEFTVDPLEGPHIALLNVTSVQPTRTRLERDQLISRWEGYSGVMHETVRDLQRGMRRGLVTSRTPIIKTIGQIEAILDTPPMDSPLVEIATGGGTWVELPPRGSVAEIAHDHLGDARHQRELRLVNLHLQEGDRLVVGTRVLIPAEGDPLSPEERGRFLHAVLLAVEDGIYPSFTAYRDFLQHDLLPAARPDETPGLSHLPGGERIYRTLIRENTSLPADECDPKAIHEYGQAEVARIRGEIATLGERLYGTRDVAEIQDRLRTDPALHFEGRDEVEAKAAEALFRASEKIDEYFGILPHADCEVVRIPSFEERDTTIAYYRQPSADGTQPGRYFINTFDPSSRPRYEAEVLAFHESIPGHHLQIAIAQELTDLPRFRRHLGSTAFVEGWALYTERLSDEMGLYSSDVDRLGVLSFDAWRACRLVVDTGLHAYGWSRQQAIDYMYANSLLARNNVENEVDRYIAWPGQALAYKIGQREILALRDLARDTLGPSFDYREFHDRILGNGAVGLGTLRGIIGRWLGRGDALDESGD